MLRSSSITPDFRSCSGTRCCANTASKPVTSSLGTGEKPGLQHFPSPSQTQDVQPGACDIWRPICSLPWRSSEPLTCYLSALCLPLVLIFMKKELRTEFLTRLMPTTSRTQSAGSHTSYSVFIGRFWETFFKMPMVVFLLIILIYT